MVEKPVVVVKSWRLVAEPLRMMQTPWLVAIHVGQVPVALAGGKGATLATLAGAGFAVPEGFIVTTHAYHAYVEANGLTDVIPCAIRTIPPEDVAALTAQSDTIRARWLAGRIPPALVQALQTAYAELGRPPVAVRSSATAEDSHARSFAGQLETALHVVGEAALLQAIVSCWSSLWTTRALSYRAGHHVAGEQLTMAVVVQRMVYSEAAGVVFTANPLTGKRTDIVIEATAGRGEDVVAGRSDPERYVVEATTGRIMHKTPGRTRVALADPEIVALARQAQAVALYLGGPQDLEWLWARGQFWVLQSRPITSLFPLPPGLAPEPLQVLVSQGLWQGTRDPLSPLGQEVLHRAWVRSMRLFGLPLAPATGAVVLTAAERLFLNVTGLVRLPFTRTLLRRRLPVRFPPLAHAMEALWEDPRLAPMAGHRRVVPLLRMALVCLPIIGHLTSALLRPDRSRARLQRQSEAVLAAVHAKSLAATTLAAQLGLLDEILEHVEPRLLSRLYAGMAAGGAAFLLLRRLAVSLPDGLHQVQALLRGVPHNVTTEMDLALWATACTLKADPTSVQRFTQADAATLAAEALAGQLPDTAQQAIAAFLQRYGMRGLVEIDLARPRWREAPEMLMQVVQRYLDIQNPAHAPDVLFAQGAATAEAALDRLVHALARTRGGWVKAWLARRAGRRLRLLAGLREHPKFFRVCWLDIMRQRLREVGRELVAGGLFTQPDDVFFLQLSELQALAAGHTRDWHTLITQRRQAYAREQTRRQIPAVLLSDGQAVFPGHRREGSCGGGLLGGTPVSPGVSEGTVRVMREPSEGTLQPGEILVCHATDPSWTPLFLLARGIVMEVGGVMTHGSVVAREYGIPALVGVDQATTRLQTGQHIRIDGASGNITILSAPPGQNAPVV